MGRLAGSVLGILLLSAVFYGPTASAQTYNQRITVYAAVPQMRNIYINAAGMITKVVGNTSQNITPRVYDEKNQAIPMTDDISRQYQEFLKAHDYHLAASKYYYLNPVSVANQPNTQTINIGQTPQQLTLAL